MTVVLRVDSVGKRFGDRQILNAATVRAMQGTVTYLMGLNGCGKSTMLRIAVGLLPADTGTVMFRGRVTYTPRWHAWARLGLFFLPDRDILAPDRTPRQQLGSVARQFGHASIDGAVEALRLGVLLDRPTRVLSTGERRRVEVAVAAVRRPLCLLADEPFRNIDPEDRLVIGAAIRRMATQGCAVIVTGHEVEDLLPTVDEVTWCTDGTTYELGSPAKALEHEQFVKRYVGSARAERMRGEILRRG